MCSDDFPDEAMVLALRSIANRGQLSKASSKTAKTRRETRTTKTTRSSATTASRCCLLSILPPELRNAIYTFHLAQYPEILVHDYSDINSEVTALTPLMRTSRQLRTEVGSLLPFYATDLLVRCKDLEFRDLAGLVITFERASLETMSKSSSQRPHAPSIRQLNAVKALRSLRPRKTQATSTTLRQFPALRTLLIELSPKGDLVREISFVTCRRLCIWGGFMDPDDRSLYQYRSQNVKAAAILAGLRIDYRLAETVSAQYAMRIIDSIEEDIPEERDSGNLGVAETYEKVVAACLKHLGIEE